jgi:adenylate kinase
LSTGDVFRAAGKICEGERSPALTAALAFMKHGDLVPDATVLEMVRERARCLRCYGGILLDGFPRTVAQAEVLDQLFLELGVRLNAAISYDLPIEKIVARLSGRRTCEKCKAVFHTETLPSKSPGVCDHCGGGLVQREDDQPDAVRIRMHAYESSTAPLADYYRQRNLLLSIPACGSPEEIFTRTISALNTFK